MLELGELVITKRRTVRVTETALRCLPDVRDCLIEVAEQRGTITYGELKDSVGFPYPTRGMGRLLDLLSVDCARRNEPSLAAIVVSARTGEVSIEFARDPGAERADLYAHWSSRSPAGTAPTSGRQCPA
jgi:hypothetical protein